MSESANQPPTDLAELQARLAAAIAERDAAIAERDEALSRNDRLLHLLRQLQRMQFGRRSEKLDPDQFALAFEDVEQAVAASEAADDKQNEAAAKSRADKRRASRGALPAHLPRVHVTIEPEDKTCPCCRSAMHVIGEDTSERLDVIPAQFRAIVTHRPKYASHGEPRVKGSFHLRTGTPLVVSVSECQALLHDAALLPSLINLTSGRRRYGCTNIPLAADRAWDDETILPVRQ